MRLRHYSIHTERTYCDWIKRYIMCHRMTNRQDLIDDEAKIEAFPLNNKLMLSGHPGRAISPWL
ncbi:MAG TPA: hypothetical protein DD719_04720 [Desulfotomaculum sp.]|nr:hypothetical protein [Desulfotomaculum sp.]